VQIIVELNKIKWYTNIPRIRTILTFTLLLARRKRINKLDGEIDGRLPTTGRFISSDFSLIKMFVGELENFWITAILLQFTIELLN